MSRRSEGQLALDLSFAAERFPIGSEWRHYSGRYYQITGFGISSATNAVEAEFKLSPKLASGLNQTPAYTTAMVKLPPVIFHRPISEWEDKLTVSGGNAFTEAQLQRLSAEEKLRLANDREIVNRFTRVYRQETFVENPLG